MIARRCIGESMASDAFRPSEPNLPPLSLLRARTQVPARRRGRFPRSTIPPAGQARRPDTADAAEQFTDLAYDLVRVLDEDGQAVGPWNPRLSPDTLRAMLRSMALVRAFDERMFRAQRQGKTSFYMKCTGEEAVVGRRRLRARPTTTCASRPTASRAC